MHRLLRKLSYIRVRKFLLYSASVALGGALGALIRAVITALIHGQGDAAGTLGFNVNGGFPYATLLVNIIGCFGLGFVIARANVKRASLQAGQQYSEAWFLFYSSGLFAALTTFSGFSNELLLMLIQPAVIAGITVPGQLIGFVYLVISILFGLFMLMLGFLLARNRYNSIH